MTPREFAIQVVQQLQAAGYEALWAGGCVRDELMGRQPKDYDVATNALPDQVRELFGKKRTIPIGVAFGVITVVGPRSAGQIEVATFRRDSQYSDGRHPDAVVFSSAQEDAQRRDFTINGMFYDPVQRRVLDYVGGQQDLERAVVRAIGNPLERIHEDKLRMLRAVRFAATFQFELDPDTLRAIQTEADKIDQISAERIGNELVKMLSHSTRSVAVRLLVDSNLLPQVLPAAWYRPEDWVGESFQNRLRELQRLDSNSGFEPAAVLLLRACVDRLAVSPGECSVNSNEVAVPPREGAVRSEESAVPPGGRTPDSHLLAERLSQLQSCWKLTNQQRDRIGWIIRHWNALAQADSLRWSQLQPLLIHETVEMGLATARAIKIDTPGLQLCEQRLKWPASHLNPPLLLRGEDLIKLGLRPGPQFKQLLQEVRHQQLEGELETVEEALRFIAHKLT